MSIKACLLLALSVSCAPAFASESSESSAASDAVTAPAPAPAAEAPTVVVPLPPPAPPRLNTDLPWPNLGLKDTILSQGVPAEAFDQLVDFLKSHKGESFEQETYTCAGREADDVRSCDDSKRTPAKRAVKINPHLYSVIVDYSLPSRAKRFFVIRWNDGHVDEYFGAHGSGSGEGDYLERFGNKKNSNATSAGFHLTGETYHGFHGLTLRLYGLEKRNDQDYVRDIVVHGAWYISAEFPKMINAKTKQPYGRMGLSWGCPAVSLWAAPRVIPVISGGAVLYTYRGPRREWVDKDAAITAPSTDQSPSIPSSLPSSSSALKSE